MLFDTQRHAKLATKVAMRLHQLHKIAVQYQNGDVREAFRSAYIFVDVMPQCNLQNNTGTTQVFRSICG
jgi:hypothetical protein